VSKGSDGYEMHAPWDAREQRVRDAVISANDPLGRHLRPDKFLEVWLEMRADIRHLLMVLDGARGIAGPLIARRVAASMGRTLTLDEAQRFAQVDVDDS
jgi:hypothetical protein